ncbi:MAG: XrtN system VIT domain-containing protein, partial [Sphingobacteriaceae bacterium]
MKKILNSLVQDKLAMTGLLLIILSSLVFLFTTEMKQSSSPGAFFINYLLSGIYSLLVFIRSLSRRDTQIPKVRIAHTTLLLILWFISAFALNCDMNVFDSSVPWLSVWIILSSFSLVIIVLFEDLPKILTYIVFFFLGASLLLFSYYAIYLLPLYAISVVGIIAIGISLHTYVPLLLALVTAKIIIRRSKINKAFLYTSVAGFILPLLVSIIFLYQWNITNQNINLVLNQNALNDVKLPAWVSVSQQIKKSPFTERIFKTGLIYHEVNPDNNFFWGGMPSRSFDQPKQHDPLVVLATLFFSKPNLDEKEQINILKSMFDSRHQAQERLWSGDNLETVSVISNVKLFPEYRMAYTEKMLMIKNNSNQEWNQQEAIYTFHLSEGSVVSSLSLWIDGKEEKSRLTTKAKADSAYHEVVGVEMHDPSVVHWQEGNTISVRVFPCNTKENRWFKIGITSPMRKEGNRLIYENVYFEGPDATKALETLQLNFSEKPDGLKVPAAFKQSSFGIYHADRTYDPGWEISCLAPVLPATAFSFADSSYTVKDYQPKNEMFSPEAIYLDVNKSWSKEEYMQVWAKIKNRPVYVYDDKLIQLT